MVFWVHNLRPSLGGMRLTRRKKFPSNGTPNTLQAAVIKESRHGLQIRPRRFDSGLGLHPENPADHGLRGFFMPDEKGNVFRIFGRCSACWLYMLGLEALFGRTHPQIFSCSLFGWLDNLSNPTINLAGNFFSRVPQ